MSAYLPGLICSLFIALILQFISIFFIIANDRSAYMLYSAGGCIIYGIYVIVDLKFIAERIEVDDYILGALTLYIDLMSLFVYILQFLGSKK
jgi:FtsH-binding integral membrane protein